MTAPTRSCSTRSPPTIATRYGRLVIGSGDGIFGTRARTARALGVDVSVVAREGGCSYQLWPFDPTLLAPAPLVLAA